MNHYLLAHWHEIATAFVLSGGLFVVYAWMRLTEEHTKISQMFEEVKRDKLDSAD